jgi:hypothetical protein
MYGARDVLLRIVQEAMQSVRYAGGGVIAPILSGYFGCTFS